MRKKLLCMFTIVLPLACIVLAAVPGMANAISDTLTVYKPDGSIYAQVSATEGAEGNGNTLFIIPIRALTKITTGNSPTTLCEALPCSASSPVSNFSDLFGVFFTKAPGQTLPGYYLGFYSDGESGTAFGSNGKTFLLETPGVPVDATGYVDPLLVRRGWTATFVSDGDVPEPTSLVLMGSGLLGLAGFSRRFLR